MARTALDAHGHTADEQDRGGYDQQAGQEPVPAVVGKADPDDVAQGEDQRQRLDDQIVGHIDQHQTDRISVSDEPLDTIEQFLELKRDETTFKELTSDYWLTTDPDGSVKQDYMRAAGQSGIPTAFIVGKTGEVEWIGHPMRIDEPVAQILDGTWDREAYEKEKERLVKLGQML